jgi:hypothetical protein
VAEGSPTAQKTPLDSGFLAFVSILRRLGKPAGPAQLCPKFSPDGENFASELLLRAAKRLDVKARRERPSSKRLGRARRALIGDATVRCDMIARARNRRRIMFGNGAPFGRWRRLSPRQICDHDTGGTPQR